MNRRARWVLIVLWTVAIGTLATTASAQEEPPAPTSAAAPVTSEQRIHWIVNGVVGPRSLFFVGPFSSGWYTAWNRPEEWGRTWSGFGKRYLNREATVAISNTVEGGLGAIWGEDPRFVPSHRMGIWPRARFAVKTVVLAPRRDGRLAPAWGRYAGNVVNNVVANAWLPETVTTPGQTALSIVSGLGGRLAGNLWDEFWPDVRKRLRKSRP